MALVVLGMEPKGLMHAGKSALPQSSITNLLFTFYFETEVRLPRLALNPLCSTGNL